MKLNNNFQEILKEEAEKRGFILNLEKLEKFENYKKLLVEWNEKMNLTAITEDYEVIIKHFIDCLECSNLINEKDCNIVDVGTGAGFPGMVLAIYYSDKQFTLIDSLNKRIIFLEEVIKVLKIKNVKVIHARAEEQANKYESREQFDVVVSRAVANLPVLVEYISGYIKVNGKCLVMKGDNIAEELKMSSNAFKILNLKAGNTYKYVYIVNNEEYNRTILEVFKMGKTPEKYPRNFGLIKKKPL